MSGGQFDYRGNFLEITQGINLLYCTSLQKAAHQWVAITKCGAAEKQQDQAEYDTVTKLPSPAKEININTLQC